jgi:protease-4
MAAETNDSKQPKSGFMRLFFSSCLGTIAGISLIVGIVVFYGVQASQNTAESIKPNSVLKLKFNKTIPELTNNVAQSPYDIQSVVSESIGLRETCQLIAKAKEDDNIKGIYLDMSSVPLGWASSKVLREQLIDFKSSDKFILSYATTYSQKSYYLASVASPLYLHPEGGFSFTGFAAQLMYFKGLMDKLGVTAQIFYAGKFKSATEPFRRKNMTPENREQVSKYMSGMYDLYLEDLAASRDIAADELFSIANNALIRNADDAVQYKMVDATKYKDEIIDELRDKLGTAEDDEMEVVSLSKYFSVQKSTLKKASDKEKVAVVYAEGSIVDGNGETGSIGGDKYASIIRKIRKDDKVKAIVMRVNSGGGSALASDIIWRELEKAKEQGIKVVTSMGDVAASGGYYIASNSEEIFAENNTITGSIGVFGMIPNTRGLYEDHLGLTMDTVKIGKFSLMSGMGMFYEFNEEEGAIIQNSVDEVYTTFKKRVSDGRGKSMEEVDEMAQGRVWLGNKALEIGLVDKIGGLEDAIVSVATLANLEEENYQLVHYPKTKSFEEKIMALFGEDSDDKGSKAELLQKVSVGLMQHNTDLVPEFYEIMKQLKTLKQMQGIQMRLPYDAQIQ